MMNEVGKRNRVLQETGLNGESPEKKVRHATESKMTNAEDKARSVPIESILVSVRDGGPHHGCDEANTDELSGSQQEMRGLAENMEVAAVQTDEPFDLPIDVLPAIFYSGTRLIAAEKVCKQWRSAIQSDPIFWRTACERIGLTKNMMTEELRVGTNGEASVWRKLWVHKTKTICQHCLSNKGVTHPLFPEVQLCNGCRNLYPYNAMCKAGAERCFGLNTKTVKDVLHKNNMRLNSYTHEMSSPWIPTRSIRVTLYRFEQVVEICKMAFGEDYATKVTKEVRRQYAIKAIEWEFPEEM